MYRMIPTCYTIRNTRQAASKEIKSAPGLVLNMNRFWWKATMKCNNIPARISQVKLLKICD